jgi:hypothetical protein
MSSLALAALLVLTACGGGGAPSPAVLGAPPPPAPVPPAPPPPPPVPPPPPAEVAVGGLTLYGGAGGMAPHVVHVCANLGAYDWTTDTTYSVGELVANTDGSEVYQCLSSHRSDAATEPGVGSSWTARWVRYGWTGSGFWAEGRWQYQFVKADGSALDQADRDWMRVTDPIAKTLVYTDDRFSSAPTAAFMFRSPGSYKVRVRYQNRDKVWSAWVESNVITVAANTRTKKYVNGTTGNDAYDGTTATVQGGTVGPKRTINAALDLINANDFEVELADDTVIDCTAHSSAPNARTGIWIHRSGGGTAKPIVVLKQAERYPICNQWNDSIIEGLEFEYHAASGVRQATEIRAYAVNTAVVDCEYNEVSELATIQSDRYPTAVLLLRLVQKERVTRYCVFAEKFHAISIMGVVWNKGCSGEHVVRLVSAVDGGASKPFDTSRYHASEYCVYEMTPGGSGKAAYNTHIRHGGAYRCLMTNGSVAIGGDNTYLAESLHDKNNVIDGCIISFDGAWPQAVNIQGYGQNVIRTSAFLHTGDAQLSGNPVIGCASFGANRFLNLSVRQTGSGAAGFYNLLGPTDDITVRGCIFSLVPSEHANGQPRFYPAPTVAQLAGVDWEDNVHTDMTGVWPSKEFGLYTDGVEYGLAQANAMDWAEGNAYEDLAFDVDWQPLGGGELWKTKVVSTQGVFRSINDQEWTTAGAAGAWLSVAR